jgi:hypothetical protein
MSNTIKVNANHGFLDQLDLHDIMQPEVIDQSLLSECIKRRINWYTNRSIRKLADSIAGPETVVRLRQTERFWTLT